MRHLLIVLFFILVPATLLADDVVVQSRQIILERTRDQLVEVWCSTVKESSKEECRKSMSEYLDVYAEMAVNLHIAKVANL